MDGRLHVEDLCGLAAPPPNGRFIMQTGLHAISWGLQRLAITLGLLVVGVIFAYVIWVTLIIAGQALSGQ
jgi:hypothetical protein